MSSIALLILDFSGVCTRSATEIVADPEAPIARPEALDLVRSVRAAGVTTVILSNELDPDWVDEHPVLAAVDHVVSCAGNRIFKPDRRAFQRCLLLSGKTAEATLVVDDEADNVTAAQALGMDTVLFDPQDPTSSWADVRTRVFPQ
jgi:putative hydrolase of the HAD superfamily